MDSSAKFCLRWNNFGVNVSSSFRSLLHCHTFADVSLVADSSQLVKAHRLVLSASSPFFSQLLRQLDESGHPVVVLRDVSHRDLQAILEFIYVGEVNVEQHALHSFLRAAQALQIKGLTENLAHSELADQRLAIKQEETEVNEPKGLIHVHPQPHRSRKSDRPSKRLSQVRQVARDEERQDSGHVEGSVDERDNEELEIDDREDDEIAEVNRRQSSETLGSNRNVDSMRLSNEEDNELREEHDEEEESLDLEAAIKAVLPVNDAKNSKNQKKTCPYCFQQLSWHALSRHIRDMHRAQATMVHCSFCGKKFRNKNSLGCHIWRFHKNKDGDKSQLSHKKDS